MRIVLLIAAGVALTACTPSNEGKGGSAPSAKTLPQFQFKKVKAGLPLKAALAEKLVENCSEFQGMTDCELVDGTIGGFPADVRSVQFKGPEFYNLFLTTSARDYDDVLRSLTSVYGKPCRVDSKKLQNAFGAEFSGDLATWRFVEGEVSFLRHSPDDVTISEFRFDPPYKSPPAKPLTAETL